MGAYVIPTISLGQAFQKLLEGEVGAVVYDSPAILYYSRNEGRDKTIIAGDLFELQYYGIAFPERSELREKVNRAILKFQQNGFYKSLYQKWFGEDL